MTEDYELKDDVHRQQYEFRIGNYTPKIEYIKSINGEIYLTHTEVPRELEGKGIGSQLVEKTLQDIERQGLRLVPLCPFVAAYIKKHPEWRRIVMNRVLVMDSVIQLPSGASFFVLSMVGYSLEATRSWMPNGKCVFCY